MGWAMIYHLFVEIQEEFRKNGIDILEDLLTSEYTWTYTLSS